MLPATVVGNLQIVTMTGGGGGGGGSDSQSGAPGYGGVTITGGSFPVSAGDVVNCFVGGGGGPGGHSGGGGGAGGGGSPPRGRNNDGPEPFDLSGLSQDGPHRTNHKQLTVNPRKYTRL